MGSLAIPGDLKADLYRFRAFTQWMRNFEGAHFFSTYLPIYGDQAKQVFMYKMPPKRISFMSEGGPLVRKLIGRLAIQTFDEAGELASHSVTLLDGDGHALDSVKSDELGQAQLELDPQFGTEYYLQIAGDERLVPIAGIRNHGTVLRVNNEDPTEITVLVQSNEPMRDEASKDGLLVVYAKGRVQYAADCKLGRSRFVANFPKKDLPAGVIEVVIFDGNLTAVAKRCIFHEPPAREIRLTVGDKGYGSRAQVRVPIRTSPNLAGGNYSLSIRRKHPGTPSTPPIHPFFFNEIHTAFIPPFPQGSESIDTWLMGQRSHTVWAKIIQDEFPKPELLIQPQPILRGRVWRNLDPAPACSLDAFFAEHHYLYEFTTDDSGRFDIPIIDFSGQAALLFVPEDLDDDRLQVVLDRERGDEFDVLTQPMSKEEETFWAQQKIRLETETAYKGDGRPPTSSNQLFYRQADLVIRPDDYIPLPSMIEVFREIVTPVQVKGNAGKLRLRVVPEKEIVAYDEAPLLLIDGWPTFDPRRLLSISPDEVDRIEVLHMYSTLKRLGRIGLYGAIAVYTRSGDFNAGRQKLVFPDFPGLQEASAFHTSDYAAAQAKNQKEPDFRATAYWEPDLILNEQGEAEISFFIGDDTGEYEIELQGLDAWGRLVVAKSSFSVNL